MILVVIPARYGSSRFPGKPLARVNGKTLIQMVWERARAAKRLERVIVATDDPRIEEAVRKFGGEAVMTAADLPSGTDRAWAAAKGTPARIIVKRQRIHATQCALNKTGSSVVVEPPRHHRQG